MEKQQNNKEGYKQLIIYMKKVNKNSIVMLFVVTFAVLGLTGPIAASAATSPSL
jgi:hypothetical protein